MRTWGNSADGETVMLTGTYQLDGEVSRRLLRALPPLLVLRDDEWDCPLIPLLADEIVKDEPGQEAVLDRLLDLLLIAVLRAWFARPEADAPGVVPRARRPGRRAGAAHAPPQPGSTPGRSPALAREIGVSRAALARRFNELVGEPPMTFLTGWRIALAADLLREPGATVGSVAHQVGYGSPFALSTAFKRVRGMSPQQYRRRGLEELSPQQRLREARRPAVALQRQLGPVVDVHLDAAPLELPPHAVDAVDHHDHARAGSRGCCSPSRGRRRGRSRSSPFRARGGPGAAAPGRAARR